MAARRRAIGQRSQDISIAGVQGHGEPAPGGTGARVSGFPSLQGLGRYAQRGQRRMRGIKTRRIRLWVKRRLLSCFRCLGSCGTTFANCTSTVLYSSKGAVELVGRFLYGDATYMRGEGDYITAGLFCKAIEQSLGRR